MIISRSTLYPLAGPDESLSFTQLICSINLTQETFHSWLYNQASSELVSL